jgi:hypothetical protein
MGGAMNYAQAVEAVQLDDGEGVEVVGGILSAPVMWPDGRVNMLPDASAEGLGPAEIPRGRSVLHLGFENPLAGMTSGYDSADLARLSSDVFCSRVSDVMGVRASRCAVIRPSRNSLLAWQRERRVQASR